jgi:DNA-binding response OmpR family regulator
MSKKTILILDKESHIQWTLMAFLESEKYSVIAMNTVDGALQNFSELDVSGIITEYWINHSRPLEAIRELKRMFPEAYVMMLTNNDVGENEYEEIINSGVDDYFLKPFSFRKILLHLRKGLKQHNILLQKNQLEEELSQIKKRGDVQETKGLERTTQLTNY